MHKDTIASIGKIERHRLVHAICFWSLRIYNRQVHLLPHLIQRGETFSTTINPFTWREQEHGVDASRIVRSTLNEIEWQEFDLRTVIINDMAGLRQNLSIGIFQDQAERILLNFQYTIPVLIDDTFVISRRIPSSTCQTIISIAQTLCNKLRRKHRIVCFVHLRFNR